MRILVIQDHCRMAEAIIRGLARFGFRADSVPTAARAISAVNAVAYDAVVLDLGLPDRDGLDLLRELRDGNLPTPILILSARDGIDCRVGGLDAGADDYLVKPFAMAELAARLRALLRRPGGQLFAILRVGNLCLEVGNRQVTVNGSVKRFTAREVEVLEILMRREGQVTSKNAIEEALYGSRDNVTPNSIEAIISRIRRRIDAIGADCAIHTLHGIGYLLVEKGNSSVKSVKRLKSPEAPHRQLPTVPIRDV